MAVRKFRSIAEMKETIRWRTPGDPALYRTIRALWEFGRRTGVHRFPRGVYRHRTIEDMDRLTEQWDAANFDEHRRRQSRAIQSSTTAIGASVLPAGHHGE